MQSEFWFWLAVVEFVVIAAFLFYFLSPYWDYEDRERQVQARKTERGRHEGVVAEVTARLTLLGKPKTTVTIDGVDGKVYYLGLEGHVFDLSEGDRIEFWFSDESVTNKDNEHVERDEDGTVRRWVENIKYLTLTKYRILPDEPEVDPEDDTVPVDVDASEETVPFRDPTHDNEQTLDF